MAAALASCIEVARTAAARTAKIGAVAIMVTIVMMLATIQVVLAVVSFFTNSEGKK